MKLGRRKVSNLDKAPKFGDYVSATLPVAEPVDYTKGVTEFGMMNNDTVGCCTIASKGHGLQIVTLNASTEVTLPDPVILKYYELIDGYNPSDPTTDKGGIISDTLDYLVTNTFAGHQVVAYCQVDPKNTHHINSAISLFGHLDVGLSLPISAENADVWDLPEGTKLEGDWAVGSLGGHDVSIHGFKENGDLIAITWGAPKIITRSWFKAYCDEAFAVLWKDWIEADGKSPEGFDVTTLQQDLKLV